MYFFLFMGWLSCLSLPYYIAPLLIFVLSIRGPEAPYRLLVLKILARKWNLGGQGIGMGQGDGIGVRPKQMKRRECVDMMP